MSELLSSEEIPRRLAALNRWSVENGELGKRFQLANFAEALRFVNEVGGLAEKAGHHPDIDIRWNKVTLRLSTHSKGGLTEKDFALAAAIDAGPGAALE